jgi:hypothetical protein
MGDKDANTTEIYADYAPSAQEGALVEQASRGTVRGTSLSETAAISDDLKPHQQAEAEGG